jgi:hypothetical protein
MDPYLEGEMWQEFHGTLANQIRGQLIPLLKPKYVALLHKYNVLDQSGLGITGSSKKQAIYPDVSVTKVKEAIAPYETIVAPTVELVSPVTAEVPILQIEIRDVAERRLVTVIEILSPVNKQGKGFRKYISKRADLLTTQTHLLELDLLREGERIPLVGGELPAAPYYAFLSRFTNHPYTAVWPIQLRDPLPTLPVPLLPPDDDVPLMLQAAVEACFELVGYHEYLLDYSQPPPPPPFSPEDAAWVGERVKANAAEVVEG